MNIVVEVGKQDEGRPLGIGIVAIQANNRHVAWATRERSTGNSVLDYGEAIKQALCKVREKHWRDVNVQVSSSQLLRCLKANKVKDIKLFAQMEDIQMLGSLLFMKYSFGLASHQNRTTSSIISFYSTKLVQNEEYLNSQCLSTRL